MNTFVWYNIITIAEQIDPAYVLDWNKQIIIITLKSIINISVYISLSWEMVNVFAKDLGA
jgi:hypothetical protein